MARKMYRGSHRHLQNRRQKNAVIWDKIGIAYHQLANCRRPENPTNEPVKMDKIRRRHQQLARSITPKESAPPSSMHMRVSPDAPRQRIGGDLAELAMKPIVMAVRYFFSA